jgi:hypothetical protein
MIVYHGSLTFQGGFTNIELASSSLSRSTAVVLPGGKFFSRFSVVKGALGSGLEDNCRWVSVGRDRIAGG